MVENPATSSPGSRVPARHRRRTSARTAGRRGGRDLRANGVEWSTAGRTPTTARSPAAASAGRRGRSSCRTRRARRPRWSTPTRPSTEAPTGVIDGGLLPPGRGRRHPARHRPRGRGRPAHRLPAVRAASRPTCRCRCSCSRCAADAALPDVFVEHAVAPDRPRSSCPPTIIDAHREDVDRRVDRPRAPVTEPGATRPRARSRLLRRAGGVPRRLLRVARRQHRRRGPAGRRRLGPQRRRRRARRRRPPRAWRGSRCGRRRRRPRSRSCSPCPPPTCWPATSSGAGASCRRSSPCRSCCRPWWWAPAFLALLGPSGPLGVDLDGTVWAILLAHAFFNHAVVVRTVGGLWELLDPAHRGGGPRARRVTVAGGARGHAPGAAPGHRLGGAHHVPVHVHVVRRRAAAGRPEPRDARGRDLPADRRPAEPARGVGPRPPAARSRSGPCWSCRSGSPGAGAGRGARCARRRAVAARGRRERGVGARQPRRRWRSCWSTPLAVLVERSFRTGDGYGLAAWRALARPGPGHRAVRAAARGAGQLAAVRRGRHRHRRGPRRPGRRRPGRAPAGASAAPSTSALLLPLGTSAVTVGFGFLIALDEPVDLRASPWLVPARAGRRGAPVRGADDDAGAALDRRPPPRGGGGARRVAGRGRGARSTCPLVLRAVLVSAGFAFAISLGEFGATTVIARADAPTVPVAIDRLLGRPGRAQRRPGVRAQHDPAWSARRPRCSLVDRVRTDRAARGRAGWL